MKLITAIAAMALVTARIHAEAQVALHNPTNGDTKSEIVRTITKSYVDGKLNGNLTTMISQKKNGLN